MQDDNARARLFQVLANLRAILAAGPKQRLPPGILLCHPLKNPGSGPDMKSFKRFDGARLAAAQAMSLILSGCEASGFLNTDIAPDFELESLKKFLLEQVGRLDRLPATRSILQRLDGWIDEFYDAAADGTWSRPKGPKAWSIIYVFSADTFKRRCKAGKIRHKKLSCREYIVHLDDIPLPKVGRQVGTSRHK
jgi:hypothetical protein